MTAAIFHFSIRTSGYAVVFPAGDYRSEIDLGAELGVPRHQDLRRLQPRAGVRRAQGVDVGFIQNVEHINAARDGRATESHSARGSEVDALQRRGELRTWFDQRNRGDAP